MKRTSKEINLIILGAYDSMEVAGINQIDGKVLVICPAVMLETLKASVSHPVVSSAAFVRDTKALLAAEHFVIVGPMPTYGTIIFRTLKAARYKKNLTCFLTSEQYIFSFQLYLCILYFSLIKNEQ